MDPNISQGNKGFCSYKFCSYKAQLTWKHIY